LHAADDFEVAEVAYLSLITSGCEESNSRRNDDCEKSLHDRDRALAWFSTGIETIRGLGDTPIKLR